MTSSPCDDLLTAAELAFRLRVSAVTVRRWARAGFIPAVNLPRIGVRFVFADVVRALQSAKHPTSEARR